MAVFCFVVKVKNIIYHTVKDAIAVLDGDPAAVPPVHSERRPTCSYFQFRVDQSAFPKLLGRVAVESAGADISAASLPDTVSEKPFPCIDFKVAIRWSASPHILPLVGRRNFPQISAC